MVNGNGNGNSSPGGNGGSASGEMADLEVVDLAEITTATVDLTTATVDIITAITKRRSKHKLQQQQRLKVNSSVLNFFSFFVRIISFCSRFSLLEWDLLSIYFALIALKYTALVMVKTRRIRLSCCCCCTYSNNS